MKKLLYWLILLFILLLLWCWWHKNPDGKGQPSSVPTVCRDTIVKKDNGELRVKRCTRERQVVVTYRNPNDPARQQIHTKLLDLHFKLVKVCDCSEKLELWEYPVGASPDGQEIKTQQGGSSGMSVMENLVVEDINYKDQPDSLSLEKLVAFVPPFPLKDKYPQVKNPVATVNVAITDSGAEDNNRLLSNNGNLSFSHFLDNAGASYCSSSPSISEGKVGMNILRNTARAPYDVEELSSEPKDLDGHGTFIGGIVADVSEPDGDYIGDPNGVNIKQVHARFIRTRDKTADLFSALCSIHYALNKGAKVINTSWRVLSYNATDEKDIKNAFYPTLDDVKANGTDKGALIVAASGNEGFNLDGSIKSWPACFAKYDSKNTADPDFSGNVLSVGAWNLHPDSIGSKRICYFSNYGSFVDIYAPGTGIVSTGAYNDTFKGQGTSYAAPFVTRAAAVLRGLYPSKTPQSIKNHIKQYGDIDSTVPDKPSLLNYKKIMLNRPVL
jgi:subtilisin family serine protease